MNFLKVFKKMKIAKRNFQDSSQNLSLNIYLLLLTMNFGLINLTKMRSLKNYYILKKDFTFLIMKKKGTIQQCI